jgi:YVTN family beta-propeller protein
MKGRLLAAMLFTCGVAVFSGCGPGNSTTQMQMASQSCIMNQAVYNVEGVRQCLPNSTVGFPGVRVSGARQQDDPGAEGNVLSFGDAYISNSFITTQQATTTSGQSIAVAFINGARVPAVWNLDWDWSINCGQDYVDSYVDPGSLQVWYRYEHDGIDVQPVPPTVPTDVCIIGASGINTASTRFAIIGNFPGSITLGGSAPFFMEFGMPLLYVYNQAGNLVATETATSVSSDGTQATFPFPSTLAQSGYELIPQNQINESPGLAPAGVNLLSIASSQTIAGNPYGVAVGAQSTETINCVYVMEGPPGHQSMTTQCSESSSNPNIIPVVSLYSANQVMIGSSYVAVGANPTAVATYTAGAIINTTDNSNGYTTTVISGSLRAIVANSGSNTVTILNTVTAAPVATVTVGNNPVALAVSSDGTTGYVANYADSTVTQINLSTNTPTTTISVGGKPTSVALTSGGTLWAGGAGFLTQVNASNMSVVGTETVPSRGIHALSFSDQIGQLVVQSNDTTGAVYQDEMDPAAFVAGGTYAAIASRTISALGTYTVRSQNLKAFTSTLSTSSVLPITLPGAGPLVVQDGWLVVAATPTGFTITDISGHQVLISQATASPIAAIAVDPNLNIAYLTEPDSNTILTVPLPGTN